MERYSRGATNREEGGMEPAKVRDAARLMVEARRTGKRVPGLPQGCRPVTAVDANAIIDEVTRQMGEPIAGWKISFLYKPREKAFRAPPVCIACLCQPCARSAFAHVLAADRAGNHVPAHARSARAGAPVSARGSRGCRGGMCVARNRRYPLRYDEPHHPADARRARVPGRAYSDHITNGAFIIGQARKDWRDLDFAVMRMRMSAHDKPIVDTEGGHSCVDPFPGAVVLANELRRGQGLQAGQVVATGSFSGFFPVQANQRITAEFVGVGEATAMFVP